MPQDGQEINLGAWLELGDGSEAANRQIQAVVREIAALQRLIIDGIARHFPGQEQAIHVVAQHLLGDTSTLTNPRCCAWVSHAPLWTSEALRRRARAARGLAQVALAQGNLPAAMYFEEQAAEAEDRAARLQPEKGL